MKHWTIIFVSLVFTILIGVGVFVMSEKRDGSVETSYPLHSLNVTTKNVTSTVDDASTTDSIKVHAVDHDIPFTSQAPLGEWGDPRQQDGCEEASALMALWWARGEASTTPAKTLATLHAITEYEQEKFSTFHDTNPEDTVTRIFQGYFSFDGAKTQKDISKRDIIDALMRGYVVITPMDGQKLSNPYYTEPGPARHMIVVRGYDPAKKQFITNDPGTRHGKAYRYDEDIFFNAIRVYPTGNHQTITGQDKSMIIVEKES